MKKYFHIKIIIQTFSTNKNPKNGDDFSIKWETKNLRLFIWDANQQDGDKIELKINNQVILSDFETKNKRKK